MLERRYKSLHLVHSGSIQRENLNSGALAEGSAIEVNVAQQTELAQFWKVERRCREADAANDENFQRLRKPGESVHIEFDRGVKKVRLDGQNLELGVFDTRQNVGRKSTGIVHCNVYQLRLVSKPRIRFALMGPPQWGTCST